MLSCDLGKQLRVWWYQVKIVFLTQFQGQRSRLRGLKYFQHNTIKWIVWFWFFVQEMQKYDRVSKHIIFRMMPITIEKVWLVSRRCLSKRYLIYLKKCTGIGIGFLGPFVSVTKCWAFTCFVSTTNIDCSNHLNKYL